MSGPGRDLAHPLPQRPRRARPRARPGHGDRGRGRPDRLRRAPRTAPRPGPAADSTVVDLDGALVTPGFVDSHVHTVRTGFALTGLDLTGAPSLAAPARRGGRARRRLARTSGVLVGQGWDETGWPEGRPPTGAELERAAPGRRCYLTRVDSHSSVVSPGAGRAGARPRRPRGLERRRPRRARRPPRRPPRAGEPDRARRPAGRRPRRLPRDGRAGPHRRSTRTPPRTSAPSTRSRPCAARPPRPGCAPSSTGASSNAVDTARRLGVAGLAGDLIADGAFGSRTAALAAPYADRAGHLRARLRRRRPGPRPRRRLHPRRAPGRLPLHRRRRARGDRRPASTPPRRSSAPRRWCAPGTGSSTSRCRRPRPSPRFARLGVVASVQPVFDALWGGPSGMYAARLGERWAVTNPFARPGGGRGPAVLRLRLAGHRRSAPGPPSAPRCTTTTRASG